MSIFIWRTQDSPPMEEFSPIKLELNAKATDWTTTTALQCNTSLNSWQRPSRSIPRREEFGLSVFPAWSLDSIHQAAPTSTTLTPQVPSRNGKPNPAVVTLSKWASSWRSNTRIIWPTRLDWSWWWRLCSTWWSLEIRISSWWWLIKLRLDFYLMRRSRS